MLQYPQLNPIAFHLGPLAVHWYGLMYLLSFACAWAVALWRAKKHPELHWTPEQISDLIFYLALGVVIGGRLGYMLFYDFNQWIAHPLSVFKVWQGGMSFHGGVIGTTLAAILCSRKTGHRLYELTDFAAPLVPIGLALGRMGNFINAELWGRVTQQPWGMIFPNGGPLPRHPSQLYELFFEGVVLFVILWWFARKPRPPFAVTGLFLLLYGVFRIGVEFFREPDVQIGYIGGWLTEGQLLSIPLIVAGVVFLLRAYRLKHQG